MLAKVVAVEQVDMDLEQPKDKTLTGVCFGRGIAVLVDRFFQKKLGDFAIIDIQTAHEKAIGNLGSGYLPDEHAAQYGLKEVHWPVEICLKNGMFRDFLFSSSHYLPYLSTAVQGYCCQAELNHFVVYVAYQKDAHFFVILKDGVGGYDIHYNTKDGNGINSAQENLLHNLNKAITGFSHGESVSTVAVFHYESVLS